MQVIIAKSGADAKRASLLRPTPGRTNVQPSWRALIVAARVEESNNKETTKAIHQIMLRGVGTADSRGEKLLESTGVAVGEMAMGCYH